MIKSLHSINKSYVQTSCQEAKEKQNQMKKYFPMGNKMELKYIKHTYQPFFSSPGSLVGITTDNVLEFNDRLTILML